MLENAWVVTCLTQSLLWVKHPNVFIAYFKKYSVCPVHPHGCPKVTKSAVEKSVPGSGESVQPNVSQLLVGTKTATFEQVSTELVTKHFKNVFPFVIFGFLKNYKDLKKTQTNKQLN